MQSHFTFFLNLIHYVIWIRNRRYSFITTRLLVFNCSSIFCFVLFFSRHFLFKTSSGTTPLFSSSSPGYPLTSGTVYTPPPRLLPRNTFSRNAFKLKKPSKYCSWKCAALSAIAAAVLLAILLAYFIGKTVLYVKSHGYVSKWNLSRWKGGLICFADLCSYQAKKIIILYSG